MPADVCHATHIETGSDKIELHRSSTNIYVNAFNAALLLALKWNHDFQLLLGTRGCIALYYVVKYIKELQSRIGTLPIVSRVRALERRMVNEASQEVPIKSRAIVRRPLPALGRAMVSEQKIGVEMAAWYLLYDSPFDSSHTYTEIYMNSIFSYVDGGRVNARVVSLG